MLLFVQSRKCAVKYILKSQWLSFGSTCVPDKTMYTEISVLEPGKVPTALEVPLPINSVILGTSPQHEFW